MSEERQIELAASGNAAAFGELYDRYIKDVYRFVSYKTHHKQTAEDITAEVFTKALARIGTFDAGKSSFRSWLYRIARNAVIDHYRTFKGTDDIHDRWDISDTADIEHDTHVLVLFEKVKPLLSQLTSEQRDILVMRIWDEMSYAEIAAALGKSEASCKMAYSRAMKQLRLLAPAALFFLGLYFTNVTHL